MKLLVSIPPFMDSLHAGRAWELYTQLMDAHDCTLTHNGDVELDKDGERLFDGALICNSDNDMITIQRARKAGIPTIYYPSFGPVNEGFAHDGTLSNWQHCITTQVKLHFAHVVLVDSLAQSQMAMAHYHRTPAFLIHPGGPKYPVVMEKRESRRLYTVGQHAAQSAVEKWGKAHAVDVIPVESDNDIFTRLGPNDLVVYAYPVWHPAGLITLANEKIPTIFPASGILDDMPDYFIERTRDEYHCPKQICASLDQALAMAPDGWRTLSWEGWERVLSGAWMRLAL